MKFIPSDAWNWSYGEYDGSTYLITNLVSDENVPYKFSTHFKKEDLRKDCAPSVKQTLCVEDMQLLADFQEGLYSINMLDEIECFDLALNAVACARFVKLTNPVSNYFMHAVEPETYISRGQIVTLYAIDGAVGDFIVLDDEPQDGLYRLMLVNKELTIFSYTLKISQMVRVQADRINIFRLRHKKARFA